MKRIFVPTVSGSSYAVTELRGQVFGFEFRESKIKDLTPIMCENFG